MSASKNPPPLPTLRRTRAGIGFTPAIEAKEHVFTPLTIPDLPTIQWLEGPEWQDPVFSFSTDPSPLDWDDVPVRLDKAKSCFDAVDARMFRQARDRANPYEAMTKSFFQNRAALKIAELDHLCDLTPSTVKGDEPFTFFDVCGGPGGFSEFLLTKFKWKAKGYATTIKGPLDFRLYKFNLRAPTETLRVGYGDDGTGDLCKLGNIQWLATRVRRDIAKEGVDLVVADGGFGVVGRESEQEVLSQRLLLSQCVVALKTLRIGGHFVCKLFDTFTHCTMDILQLLWRCFDHFGLVKPATSRPANSERYVVCKGFRQLPSQLATLEAWIDRPRLPTRLFPMLDATFYTYVHDFTVTRANDQCTALAEITRHLEDPDLGVDETQKATIRRACLKTWGLEPPTLEAYRTPLRRAPIVRVQRHGRLVWIDARELSTRLRARTHHVAPPVTFVVLPQGETRSYLLLSPRGSSVHLLEKVDQQNPTFTTDVCCPPDTVLDVVICNKQCYLVDVWCIPDDPTLYLKPRNERMTWLALLSKIMDCPVLESTSTRPTDRRAMRWSTGPLAPVHAPAKRARYR